MLSQIWERFVGDYSAVTVEPPEVQLYDPDEPRDYHGRWTRAGSPGPWVDRQVAPDEELVNPIDRSMPVPEKASALRKRSEKNFPLLKGLMEKLDKLLGTRSKANLKKEETIAEKAQRPSIVAGKPWHSVEHLRDALRAKTIVSNLDQIEDAVKLAVSQGAEPVKIDTRKMFVPKEWGFRAVMIDLKLPDGQLAEWYLPIEEVEEVKDHCHLLYEKWRDCKYSDLSDSERAEYIKDAKRSKRAYDEALAEARKRLGQSAKAWEASLTNLSASLEPLMSSKFA